MMRPPRGFWSFMILMASCVHRNMPVKLVATTFCQVSNGRSSSGTGGAPMPALLNSTSRRPKLDFTVANSARIDSRFDTSVGTASACAAGGVDLGRRPCRASPCGGRRAPGCSRLSPSAIATARPTPVPAPVTSAIFADALIGFPSLNAIVAKRRHITKARARHHRARASVLSAVAEGLEAAVSSPARRGRRSARRRRAIAAGR